MRTKTVFLALAIGSLVACAKADETKTADTTTVPGADTVKVPTVVPTTDTVVKTTTTQTDTIKGGVKDTTKKTTTKTTTKTKTKS